jgi:hypothetical protein
MVDAVLRDVRERPLLTLIAFVAFIAASIIAVFYFPYMLAVLINPP